MGPSSRRDWAWIRARDYSWSKREKTKTNNINESSSIHSRSKLVKVTQIDSSNRRICSITNDKQFHELSNWSRFERGLVVTHLQNRVGLFGWNPTAQVVFEFRE